MIYETTDTKSIRNIIANKTHVKDESTLNNRVRIQKLADEEKNFAKIISTLLKEKFLTLKEASVFALRHGFYGVDGKRLPRANFTEIPMIFEKINRFPDINTPDVAMIIYNTALSKLATADIMQLIKVKSMTDEDVAKIFHLKSTSDDNYTM